jgi:hypothetical protein
VHQFSCEFVLRKWPWTMYEFVQDYRTQRLLDTNDMHAISKELFLVSCYTTIELLKANTFYLPSQV